MENANTTLNYGEMSFAFSRAYPFLAGVCSGTVCQQFVSTDVLPFHSHRHTHTHKLMNIFIYGNKICVKM